MKMNKLISLILGLMVPALVVAQSGAPISVNGSGTTLYTTDASGATLNLSSPNATSSVNVLTANTNRISVNGAGDVMLKNVQAITPAGATQGTATQITGTLVFATGGTVTSADGIKLPAAEAGKLVIISCETGYACALWPASGDAIDDGAGDAETTIADNAVSILVAKNDTTWYRITN